jgi:hypothetical protein
LAQVELVVQVRLGQTDQILYLAPLRQQVVAVADIRQRVLAVDQVVAVDQRAITHLKLGVLALQGKDMLVVKALISPVFGKVAEVEVAQVR